MSESTQYSGMNSHAQPLLVFDLDGTLIDSAPDIVRAANMTLVSFGKDPLPTETIVAHIGEGLSKLISDLFEPDNLTAAKAEEIYARFLKTYEEQMTVETHVFPGVDDFLQNYSGKIGIITNKNERMAKKIITHLGLDQYPWVAIFGADTLAEKKPSPLPLQTMMKMAGAIPDNTIMIGDGTPDMASAQRAGTRSIAIEFGYTDMAVLEKYEPTGVLKHYRELKTLLTHIR